MKSYYIEGIPILYQGNLRNDDLKTNILPEGTVMQIIRLKPQTWNELICLRWEVMGVLAASGKWYCCYKLLFVFRLLRVAILVSADLYGSLILRKAQFCVNTV